MVFLVPPRWTVEPIDQNAVVGHGVSIACQAEGFPIPTVTWKQSIGKSRLSLPEYPSSQRGGEIPLSLAQSTEKLALCLTGNHPSRVTYVGHRSRTMMRLVNLKGNLSYLLLFFLLECKLIVLLLKLYMGYF